MQATYTLKNGVKLSTFITKDIIDKDSYRKVINVQRIRHNKLGKPFRKKVFKDSKGVYIVWDNDRVYLENYDFMPVSEFVEYIKEERAKNSGWFEDRLMATIVKDTENFGILFDLPIYEFIIPQIGMAITGDKEVRALCVPTEKHYDKNIWWYKFTIEVENEAYKSSVASRDMYMSDFASMILRGDVDIVVKNDFINAHSQSTIVEKEKILY